TVLNAIVVRKGKPPEPLKPGRYHNPDFTPPDVFKLSEQSGGEAMHSGKIGETFQEMIERIRARYNIQYQAPPAEPGSFRHVAVQLSSTARRRHPEAVVRARAGQYVSQ